MQAHWEVYPSAHVLLLLQTCRTHGKVCDGKTPGLQVHPVYGFYCQALGIQIWFKGSAVRCQNDRSGWGLEWGALPSENE